MISRISILLLILIVLPDLYVYLRYLRYHWKTTVMMRISWWLPALVMTVYTICLSMVRSFAPERIEWLNAYLLLFGVLVVPKVLFAIFSIAGWGICRLFGMRRNAGNLLGMVSGLLSVIMLVYGSTLGFSDIRVNRIDFYSDDLPETFDGYRIVQFSDAHVGTYTGINRGILAKAVDSINAQRPDAIVFTGDLQNMQPSEITPVRLYLMQLRAKDGVFSVLGNHDYAEYIKADSLTRITNELLIKQTERDMGWDLLLDEHRVIRRGADSIVIAGMENDGRPPFPEKGSVTRTMAGVSDSAFVVMLQHDPTSWRRHILPQCKAQLTLSGHTHAGQFRIFGWSPVAAVYDEWAGMYSEGKRSLFVSTGLGGFVPFRFGVPGEVVVITLHGSKK